MARKWEWKLADGIAGNNRVWLNPAPRRPGACPQRAAVIWSLSGRKGGGYVDGSLQIGDCSRQIYLDFDVYSESDRKAKLRKMDRLIGEAIKMRAILSRVKFVKVPVKSGKKGGDNAN